VLLLVLPLATALLAHLGGRWLQAILVFIVPAAMGAGAAVLAWHVLAHGPGVVAIGGWTQPLGIAWQVDGLSVTMLLVGVVVVGAVAVSAPGYFRETAGGSEPVVPPQFWPLVYGLWASLNALFLSADIFNIYVALELLTLCSVGLIVLAGTPQSMAAALRYLLLGLMGSLFYLLGVGLLYGRYGVLDLQSLAVALQGDLLSWTAVCLMIVGLLVKTALFPLHFWLPAAHASAPTPVSALLSALVVKGAFYLVLRLWFTTLGAVVQPAAAQLLGVLGACAVVWGSVQALRAERLKLLIAYSTVAQLGYLFLVFPLASAPEVAATAWLGGVLLAVAHAPAKAAMFLAAGRIRHLAGDDRLDRLHGIGQRAPMAITATALAGVSLMGLPPSGGFAGKWLLLVAGLKSGQWWWALLLIVGGLMTACYLFRFWIIALAGSDHAPRLFLADWRRELPALLLAVAAVGLIFVSRHLIGLLQIGIPLATGGLGEVPG
jgi:formate hydrogenlyase subunit 3/multisubunit Na+/H+ antiporter MnhD subunit